MYNKKYIHLKHNEKIKGQLSSKRHNMLGRCVFVLFSSREAEVS